MMLSTTQQEFCNKTTKELLNCFRRGGKCLVIGNGGSLAMASHLAGELVCKFDRVRRPLPAITLNDPNVITAIGNDFGFEFVFSRQVEALATLGDILVTLSTSGKSPNILKAIEAAKGRDLPVVSFPTNGELGLTTPQTQEVHLAQIHEISKLVESEAAEVKYLG